LAGAPPPALLESPQPKQAVVDISMGDCYFQSALSSNGMFLRTIIYNFFNFGGEQDAFFGSTMPFIRQDYKLHSLINPIFKKKNFE
jgi:hypothetical protein